MSIVQQRKESFQQAERELTSFLAPIEKKALIWMAGRTPMWINSDHLTVLGLVAMAAAGLSYWYSRWNRVGLVLVILCLVLNWVGDSLDGTLARFRNQQRPRYGFYVDHVVDAVGTLFLLGGLGLSGYMSERVATGLIIAYFLLTIEVYLATYTIGKFHISFWKWGPTELRLLLMIGNIALFYRPIVTLFGHKYLLFDVGGLIGILGMTLMFLWAAARHTRHLYRSEPLP
jgi:archaetidylinositol phosphate synthase